MKRLFILITLSLIGNMSWTTAKVSYEQIMHIYYNTSKNTNHGTHRAPMKSSNLPITWLEGRNLHFIWQADEANVSISILDKDQTILYGEKNELRDGETIINVSDLEEGEYTLILIINGHSYFAVLKL